MKFVQVLFMEIYFKLLFRESVDKWTTVRKKYIHGLSVGTNKYTFFFKSEFYLN